MLLKTKRGELRLSTGDVSRHGAFIKTSDLTPSSDVLAQFGELHPEYKERSSGLVAQGRRCCARSGWRKSQLVVVRVSPRSKLSLVRAPGFPNGGRGQTP